MFGYPGLDAVLDTSPFGGDVAFSDRQNRPRLAKPSLCSRPLETKKNDALRVFGHGP